MLPINRAPLQFTPTCDMYSKSAWSLECYRT